MMKTRKRYIGALLVATAWLSCATTLLSCGLSPKQQNGSGETATETTETAESRSSNADNTAMSNAIGEGSGDVAGDASYTVPDSLLPSPAPAKGSQLLRRKAYVCSFNLSTLMPDWVAWKITADHADGAVSRKGVKFHPDADVPENCQVTTYDYMRSGYDRGHMCPAGDNKWDAKAMEESFLMTNICPQDHGLNIGDWNEMEMQCRRWAQQYGEVYIVCGPILFRQKHATIGQEHRVTVPEAFFKVVLCLKGEPKAIGFIYRNTDGNRPKGDYVNSIDQVERITGLDFFHGLNAKTQKKVEAEADLNLW